MVLMSATLYRSPLVNYKNVIYDSPSNFIKYLESLNNIKFNIVSRAISLTENEIDIVIEGVYNDDFTWNYCRLVSDFEGEEGANYFYFIESFELLNSIYTQGEQSGANSTIKLHLVKDSWHSNLWAIYNTYSYQNIVQSHMNCIKKVDENTFESIQYITNQYNEFSHNFIKHNLSTVLWLKVAFNSTYNGETFKFINGLSKGKSIFNQNIDYLYFPLIYFKDNKIYNICYNVGSYYYSSYYNPESLIVDDGEEASEHISTILVKALSMISNDAIISLELTYNPPIKYYITNKTVNLRIPLLRSDASNIPKFDVEVGNVNMYCIDFPTDDTYFPTLQLTLGKTSFLNLSNKNFYTICIYVNKYSYEPVLLNSYIINDNSIFNYDKNTFDENVYYANLNSYPYNYKILHIGEQTVELKRYYRTVTISIYYYAAYDCLYADISGRYYDNDDNEINETIINNLYFSNPGHIVSNVSKFQDYYSQFGNSKMIMNGISTVLSLANTISSNNITQKDLSYTRRKTVEGIRNFSEDKKRDALIRSNNLKTNMKMGNLNTAFAIADIVDSFIDYGIELNGYKNVFEQSGTNDLSSLFKLDNIWYEEVIINNSYTEKQIIDKIKRFGFNLNIFDDIFKKQTTSFKYIKTINCNIANERISFYDNEIINTIFDSGVTIWYSNYTNNIGKNYDINNNY